MKRRYTDFAVATALAVLYATLCSAIVSAWWMNLPFGWTPNSLFGCLPALPLFHEVPNAVAYGLLGFLILLISDPPNRAPSLFVFCCIASGLQLVMHRWQFADGVSWTVKTVSVAPAYLAPWTAWLGTMFMHRKESRTTA